MPGRSVWSLTPQQSIEAECARRGRPAVVDGCAKLIVGEPVDESLIRALGGPGADKFFDGAQHDDLYWFRVWGARGLLWAWEESATPAILAALEDESWRVREMGLKVIARHLLGDALEAAAALRDDSVLRVREAARRAVVLLTQAGA
ncbi:MULTISPECIES: HEAT repeat domain-containing protein [Amycolatopsis]|uniref:HEAT repeat domain-containing protein n=1 Tax=Amycolatopsis dendrobii TaxID=2760662 RepID=A0A7W3VRG7_9PSEU|nr:MULTISPECIES: HEAT repeat domain-containing protein [Amycolatopsis]MBB1151741.1 HEAT repeat domain-containing protein [Amycolatopsis dendrobii]UKD58046.1 HEAT repeat domain-containing protein [Amycolatopsis sp. FU40]